MTGWDTVPPRLRPNAKRTCRRSGVTGVNERVPRRTSDVIGQVTGHLRASARLPVKADDCPWGEAAVLLHDEGMVIPVPQRVEEQEFVERHVLLGIFLERFEVDVLIVS